MMKKREKKKEERRKATTFSPSFPTLSQSVSQSVSQSAASSAGLDSRRWNGRVLLLQAAAASLDWGQLLIPQERKWHWPGF
jgi:hypothetical protein